MLVRRPTTPCLELGSLPGSELWGWNDVGASYLEPAGLWVAATPVDARRARGLGMRYGYGRVWSECAAGILWWIMSRES